MKGSLTKFWFVVGIAVVGYIVFGLVVRSSLQTAEADQKKQVEMAEEATNENKDLKKENKKLKSELESLRQENDELAEKVEEAKPWFEMTKAEQKQKEEDLKKEEEAKKAEAKKKKEAEAKAKAEKEKKGYASGITYDQLARTPDKYKGEKITFTGEVLQVMEGDGETEIRVAVGSDYDRVLYGAYTSDIVEERVLEGDTITLYGLSGGLITYESTMGGNISIPSVLIEKMDQ